VIMAEVANESVHEVFTGFGARDLPSGKVVGDVIDQVREYLASSAPVGEYLADQLMIPLALAGGGSYRAVKASLHARTNAAVIGQFLDRTIEICDRDGAALFGI
jgi:RNA 3'-terminal phosphate cyclase (ATP)